MTEYCTCGHAKEHHFINGCMYSGTSAKRAICECRIYEFMIEDIICECWD